MKAASVKRDKRPIPPRLLWLIDILLAVTVVPVFLLAWITTRFAWRVYHPQRRPVKQTPLSYGLPGERVWIPGADDVALAAWFIPAPDARDVVVVGHGMGRSSGSLMPLAKALHDAGYHVLAFDLRNHGDSADDRLFRGQSWRIGTDFRNVVRYAAQRPEVSEGHVACLGISMSSWTALDTARLEPGCVRAVICDSGPTMDVRDTIAAMFAAYRHRLPRPLRGSLMSGLGRLIFTRASIFFLVPAPWPPDLSQVAPRVLFIVGEADPVTRPADVVAQAASYPWAQVWIVPKAGHMQAFTMAADQYVQRVTGLLAEAFNAAGPRGHAGSA
jgi:uncharacterized protein